MPHTKLRAQAAISFNHDFGFRRRISWIAKVRFPDRGRLTIGWVAQMSELKSISDESVPSVPNGTATTAELEALVVRYNGYAKKSVQGFLGLAETLLEAKANFPDQLTEFCRRLDLSGRAQSSGSLWRSEKRLLVLSPSLIGCPINGQPSTGLPALSSVSSAS